MEPHAIAAASIQRRDCPLSAEKLRKKYRLLESERAFLFFTRDAAGSALHLCAQMFPRRRGYSCWARLKCKFETFVVDDEAEGRLCALPGCFLPLLEFTPEFFARASSGVADPAQYWYSETKHFDFLLMEYNTPVSIFETRNRMVPCRLNDFYEGASL